MKLCVLCLLLFVASGTRAKLLSKALKGADDKAGTIDSEILTTSKQVRPRRDTSAVSAPRLDSWLNKTTKNNCTYTAANRCIYASTYDKMKAQYQWLTGKHSELQTALTKQNIKLKNVESSVISHSRNLTNRFAVLQMMADVDTQKTLWSDEINKIRDLSVTLNGYAEYLFSSTATTTFMDDNAFNENIQRFLDENKAEANDILRKSTDDVVAINKKTADILDQLPSAPVQNVTPPNPSTESGSFWYNLTLRAWRIFKQHK